LKESIQRQMTIEEIFRHNPGKSQQLAEELARSGLHCAGCSASAWETLEAGMAGHGMNETEITALVGRLNQILDNPEDQSTICLTEKAAEKFREILAEENKSGWGLRFGINSSGCCGGEYFLDYSQKARSDDTIFESYGIQIHVQQKSAPQLLGTIIDYVDGKHGAGFKISNPSCSGCCQGHSHNCCS
jgi:iron-sulfur cluster assembly accessory protein